IYNSIKDKNVEIIGIGITGSGRQIAGLFTLTEGIINEIIAHATAAVYFDPNVDTIFEIGGQDAKYTHLTNGVASDYAMNEACSAGTGSFLEESAKESFNIDYRDIADLALQAEAPPNFNDQCAAFISSDIKNATHEGISRNDILAGLVYSICFNYVNRVKGHRPVGNKIFMQGGVCYNKAVPLAMAFIINKPIIVPPDPGLMGAFGVALEVKKRINLGLLKEQNYNLKEIIDRKVTYEKPFICAGGKEKCDLKCNINMIRIGEKVYPFGGACNRYYNIRFNIEIDASKNDFVRLRNELAFTKYCPPLKIKPGALTIGINKSFISYQIFPLYYNFFRNLGCNIVIPDKINEKSIYRQTTSFCFPAQVALGLFDNLIDKNPDFYFMPHTEEMYVAKGNSRKEFSSTCIFVQGEAFWMQQIYKDKVSKDKIIALTLNFRKGYECERKKFIEIGKKLGFSTKDSAKAFDDAVAMQLKYREEKKEIGKKFLEELHKDPTKVAIVLFGPPHNALSDDTNKGIPKKISSRNYEIIPFDLLPSDDEVIEEPYDDYMHWEIGQKIIRASQMVKKDKQLFGIYITNFLCAMDSLLVSYFRRIMKDKPNLTIEIDGHTADAGIDTRIEAFIDVIKNYLEVKSDIKTKVKDDFIPARISLEKSGMYFIDSNGEKISFKDPRVKMIMPSMGDISTKLFVSVLRRVGINADFTGVSDKETLQLGRSVTTGKECLPMILCVGSMLKYLKYRKTKDEKLVIFQPRAAGYCRLGQYHVFMNLLIKERKIRDVALLSLANEEKYAGLGSQFTINAWKAIVTGDVLDDIRNTLWTIAEDPDYAEDILNKEIKKMVAAMDGSSSVDFYKQLKLSVQELKKIPLKMKLKDAPEIAVMGEIFVRRDSFSNKDIARRLARRGFIARISHVSEWIYYLSYMINNKLHIPNYTLWGWLEFFISDVIQRKIEKEIKDIFSESGLYQTELINIEDIIKYSEHILPKNLKGEPGMILGTMLRDIFTKYAGIINIGPFSCMPVRFTESIANNILDMRAKIEAFKYTGITIQENGFKENDRIPFLTIEVDGNPWTQIIEARFESFCLQAERVAQKQGKFFDKIKFNR
ncbi:MAG: acyl-CoA dehydratase activase-related protein, partial [Candidatus Goldbacteria bacterium]|nr:acyl-CoA dehydratase activase-related protein [Candidatus Goldiibacteriota bacterium]